MNIIQIPDCLKDIYLFEKFILFRKKIFTDGDCVLDLSNITFIEPYSMVGLILTGREYLRNTSEKITLINIPFSVLQYLIRMNFTDTGIFNIEQKIDAKKLFKRSAFSKKVVEITEIPNKETESISRISAIIAKFRSRAQFILKYWLDDDITDYFVTVISEVCQNIFEHSLDSGYISIQTYEYNNEKSVGFVISDSGIGIDGSFEKYSKNQYGTGAELIKNVLTEPISSKRDFGYGLCRVSNIVQQFKGSIFIRSNTSSVTMISRTDPDKKNEKFFFLKNNIPEFNGTQISIILKA
ncbi:MAG: ATP-binding protein [Spirochaetes bacterium]|nr:ATP-binding protein [Spirochaetota bacterium]